MGRFNNRPPVHRPILNRVLGVPHELRLLHPTGLERPSAALAHLSGASKASWYRFSALGRNAGWLKGYAYNDGDR